MAGEEFIQVAADKPLVRGETIRPAAIDLNNVLRTLGRISNDRDKKRSSAMTKFTNNDQRKSIRNVIQVTVAGLVMLLTAASCYADCGPMARMKFPVVKLPLVATANLAAVDGMPNSESLDSIVGLWHTNYTADNAPFAETFKEWHSDGTEFENVNHNPASGSVCVGVWKVVGTRTVRLHHMGFLFNADGTSAGTFVVDETDTLATPGRSYAGAFTFSTYDVNGNMTSQVKGTVAATRITVD